jgi:hypothetical protein
MGVIAFMNLTFPVNYCLMASRLKTAYMALNESTVIHH